MKKRSNVVIESMISLNTSLDKLKFGDKLVPKVITKTTIHVNITKYYQISYLQQTKASKNENQINYVRCRSASASILLNNILKLSQYGGINNTIAGSRLSKRLGQSTSQLRGQQQHG